MMVQNWNGEPARAVRSRGGVTSFVDYRDNLIRDLDCSWPPPELLQKLCRSDRSSAFLAEDQAALTEELGYYSDLQSVHSEDAIQWSYFGPLAYGAADARVLLSNFLAELVNIPSRNTKCTVALWRRVPHPDTMGAGGPELDLLIVADSTVFIVESKWRSGEGRWQGMSGKQSQLQLRRQFIERCGPRLFGNRDCVLLYVVLDKTQQPLDNELSETVPSFSCEWAELCDWKGHPNSAEIRRYYEWKRSLVARGFGVPAPGRGLKDITSISPSRVVLRP
jgi:hypothetical protein